MDIEWISSNPSSPLTRNPLSVNDLTPNRLVRDILNGTVSVESRAIDDDDDNKSQIAMTSPPDPDVSLQFVDFDVDHNLGLIRVRCSDDDSARHHPTTIVCVLDVSYSMDSIATIHGDNEGRSGLTLLDIVKHATRTVIESLCGHDSLAIVTYSDISSVVLPLTKMTRKSKEEAWRLVNSLRTTGSTNLWAGLKSAMDMVVSSEVDDNCNSSILLLTDGQPNIEPPRGHIPSLKRYMDMHPTFKSSVNTFGFGYNLDTQLLDALAKEGTGHFSFIPDASFVGTAFISTVANILASAGKPSTLNIEASIPELTLKRCMNYPCLKTSDGSCITITIPYLRYGQEFYVLIEFDCDLSHNFNMNTEGLPIKAVLNAQFLGKNSQEYIIMEADSEILKNKSLMKLCRARTELVTLVSAHVDSFQREVKNGGIANDLLSMADKNLQDVLAKWNDNDMNDDESLEESSLMAVLKDFEGQVTEALSRYDWYDKWGAHYLHSISRAHELQQCTNFKDPGVQIYAAKKFSVIRDACEDLFVNLPPPKPTGSRGVSNSGSAVSMRTYHNSNAPCFASGPVLLADGKVKDVSEIQKGDFVQSSKGPAVVKCVVLTKCEGGTASLVRLSDCILVTPWHPVKKKILGEWLFPADLKPPVTMSCHQVYSFILEDGVQDMVIGSFYTVCLGHGIKNDPIVSHDFLGTTKVIRDISRKAGFKDGLVILNSNPAIRDPISGLIMGFKENKNVSMKDLIETPYRAKINGHFKDLRELYNRRAEVDT